MPRSPRACPGGMVFHVLNRANGRLRLFRKPGDFEAMETILAQAVERTRMRLLAYCLMGNHWHLLLWPKEDNDVTRFMAWLTVTHANRWHAHHGTAGIGHIYQGRFKSFPVEQDDHLQSVWRYVERNPLRAGIVRRSLDWKWSSLHLRYREKQERSILRGMLCDDLIELPPNWSTQIDQPQTAAEEEQLALSIAHGRPFGTEHWNGITANQLGLSLRPRGRPRTKQNHPEKKRKGS